MTLERLDGARCLGIAYELAHSERAATLAELDEREVGGYDQAEIEVRLAGGGTVQALTYLATPHNPNYLGPARIERMVAQILASAGISGANADYVIRLDETVAALGGDEQETRELADAVRAALKRRKP